MKSRAVLVLMVGVTACAHLRPGDEPGRIYEVGEAALTAEVRRWFAERGQTLRPTEDPHAWLTGVRERDVGKATNVLEGRRSGMGASAALDSLDPGDLAREQERLRTAELDERNRAASRELQQEREDAPIRLAETPTGGVESTRIGLGNSSLRESAWGKSRALYTERDQWRVVFTPLSATSTRLVIYRLSSSEWDSSADRSFNVGSNASGMKTGAATPALVTLRDPVVETELAEHLDRSAVVEVLGSEVTQELELAPLEPVTLDAGQLDARQLDARQLDAGQLDARQRDARQLDAGQRDAGQLDARQLDAGQLDAGQLEAGQLDAGQLDARQLDARQLDARQLDAKQLDASDARLDARQLDARQLDAGPHTPTSEACRLELGALAASLQPGAALLLGDVAGTNESTAALRDVVCHALAAGLPVTVGLPLASGEQRRVNTFLLSDGGKEARAALLEGPFWRNVWPDGRGSLAMVSLLERLRVWRLEGKQVSVVAIDSDIPGNTRTAFVSARLFSLLRKHPGRLLIALMSNTMAARRAGADWNPGFLPVGYRLAAAGAPVSSFDLGFEEGTQWTCRLFAFGRLRCGTWAVQPGPRQKATPRPDRRAFGWRFTLPSKEGFDGLVFVGKVTASPPAVGAKDDLGDAAPGR